VNGAAPQVPFTKLKSPVLPPVLVTLETFNVAVPVLVMVSVMLAEVLPTMVDGKFSVTALRATCGLEARPVPLSATTGLPPSSVEVRLPLFAPAEPGAKVTFTVHEPFGASTTGEGQVFVCVKLAAMLRVECSGAAPMFLSTADPHAWVLP
jgi:hypothetical protein